MAKLNVYVPDDLKRRMGKAKDVNWSNVACEAFERRLGELAAKKETKIMADVVQRLRASAIACASESTSAGAEWGYDWAKDSAEVAELKRLERAFEPDIFIIPDGNAYCGAEVFLFLIRPDFDKVRDEARDFWVNEIAIEGSELPDDEFVQSFAEAALRLWREAAPQI